MSNCGGVQWVSHIPPTLRVLLLAHSELSMLMEALENALNAPIRDLVTLLTIANLSTVETEVKEVEVTVLIERIERCLNPFIAKISSINHHAVRDLLMADDLQTGRKGMGIQEADNAIVRYIEHVEGFHQHVSRYYKVFKQVLKTGTEKGWECALDTHVEQFVAFGLLKQV